MEGFFAAGGFFFFTRLGLGLYPGQMPLCVGQSLFWHAWPTK